MDNLQTEMNAFRAEIESYLRENIEEDCLGRTKPGFLPNRVRTRHVMIFLLFGSHSLLDQEARDILSGHLGDMLYSPDSCIILPADSDPELPKKVWQSYFDATRRGANVENNNAVFLFPVVTLDPGLDLDYLEITRSVSKRFLEAGKQVFWQSFLVTAFDRREYRAVFPKQIVCLKEAVNERRVGEHINNHCLLSTSDELGHYVPAEQLMQTVAVTSVLLNTSGHGDFSPVILQQASQHVPGSSNYFFTGRSVSVTYPVRTLTLKRMLMAIDYFSGKTDPHSNGALKRIDYSFIQQLASEVLENLPHCGKNIDFMPLCALMPGSDYEDRLEALIDEIYLAPVCSSEAVNALKSTVTNCFFYHFFNNNGSLEDLSRILQKSDFMEISSKGSNPLPLIKETVKFSRPAEAFAATYNIQAERILLELSDIPRKLTAALIEELKRSEHLQRVHREMQYLETVRDAIRQGINRLSNYEIQLEEDPEDWLQRFSDANKDVAVTCNQLFDYSVSRAIFGANIADTPSAAARYREILSSCYEFLKLALETHSDYYHELDMKSTLSASIGHYYKKLQDNWLFTVPGSAGGSNTIYMIGDPASALVNGISRRIGGREANGAPSGRVVNLGIDDYNRIDILRISESFNEDRMLLSINAPSQGGEAE